MERGDRLGRYTLEVPIARGGMGEVWRADQDGIDRPVAIKILRADVQSERARALFEREADNLARLNSPHTLRILDTGVSAAGAPYIVTELLEGEDLWARILREGPLGWREAIAIADQVLRALAEAHALNLVHRDIKPANIFLQRVPGDGYAVKVLDFGISKLLDPQADDTTLLPGMKGSPRYMAPEQIDGRRASPAIDIYAMGALLYCMLAGEPPFKGELIVVLRSHLRKQPQSLRARGIEVPAALDALVMRCLHKDPAVRPTSAAEVRALLERCDQPAAVRTAPASAAGDEGWIPPTATPTATSTPLVRTALIGLGILLVGILAWRTTRGLLADDAPPPEPSRRPTLSAIPPAPPSPDASIADVRRAMVRVQVGRPARFIDLETAEVRCDAATACLVPAERGLRIEIAGFQAEVVSPGELAAHRGDALKIEPKR